jgi:hypothetical protein
MGPIIRTLRPSVQPKCASDHHEFIGPGQGADGSGKVGDTGSGTEAEAGRDTGLEAEAEAGRDTGLGAEAGGGEDSEFFTRIDCPISCSFVISRVICSWSALSWSTLRAICS